MINFRTVFTLIKKEIKSFLDNPASYIVWIVFLVLWQFMFFKNVFLVGEASLRSMYDLMPWIMLILVPAVTMGSITKEKDEGTLELVLTHPVSELEFLIGKFFGSLVFISLALLFSLSVALSLSRFGSFDWGVYSTQLFGSVLFAASFASLGIFVSSVLSSQVASLLLTAGLGFVFIVSGSDFFTSSAPLVIVPVLQKLSLVDHFQSMARGVIDLRDFWYFISFIAVFLSLSYLWLLKRIYGNKKSVFINYQAKVVLFIGIAALTNIIGDRIPGRIDLTKEKIYTLSGATKGVLGSLPDIVTVELYASSRLPVQYLPVLRDTKDLLSDYKNFSKGNIVLRVIDPGTDQQKIQEAIGAGMQEVQFNVVGQEEFQVKTGFLGIVLSYAGKTEVISFVQGTADLEYQLTSLIKKLTTKDKKVVAFLGDHGEKDVNLVYKEFSNELSKQYETQSYSFNKEKPVVEDKINTLVIGGPNGPMSDAEKQAIRDFIGKGKSVVFLIDMYSTDTGSLLATPTTNNLADLVSEYGVTVNTNMVYDLSSNETIRFGAGSTTFFIPYPFWARSLVKNATPVTARIQGVALPWASSLTLDEGKMKDKGYIVDKLLVSTPYASTKSGDVVINPQQQFPRENLSEQLLAVALKPLDSNNSNLGRIVVVGDSDFLTDDFVMNSPENLVFGMNAVSWLAQEESLAAIKIKNATTGRLIFKDPKEQTALKYFNLGVAVVIPALLGVGRIARRRKLVAKKYEK